MVFIYEFETLHLLYIPWAINDVNLVQIFN